MPYGFKCSTLGKGKLVTALLGTLLLAAGPAQAATEAEMEAHAAELQARLFTIDTHIDTPTASLRRKGWDVGQRHDEKTDGSQCDFPRMREGGLKSAFFAIYESQGPLTPAGRAAVRDHALLKFAATREAVISHPQDAELAFTADDGPRIAATGKRAIYLSIENGYVIGEDLTLMKTYYQLGARIFGFTHFTNNDLGDSSTDPKGLQWHGLSPLGKQAVAEGNRLGYVLDASHASDDVLRDLLKLSQTPIILSHSGCKAVYNHPRNIDDATLRQLAAEGGVIQMNTLSSYLVATPPNPELNAAMQKIMAKFGSSADRTDEQEAEAIQQIHQLRRQYPGKRGSIDDFLKHLFHAIEIAGVDHVGIGSDMDGGGGLDGLEDVSTYGKITLALVRHGCSDADIAKIWGGNTLRLLRTAQEYAAAHQP